MKSAAAHKKGSYQTYELPVRMRVIGEIIWPQDGDNYEVKIITRIIERLAAMGFKLAP